MAGILLAPACQQQPPDTGAADEQALRDIVAQWSKTGAAKDIEQIMSFYADGAKNDRANAPIESGKDAIRAGQIKEFAQKTLSSPVKFPASSFLAVATSASPTEQVKPPERTPPANPLRTSPSGSPSTGSSRMASSNAS